MLVPWKKSYNQPRHHIKKQRDYFAKKSPSSQGYDFSSGHVWMWELDHKESWTLKNWCFWTVVLEKTLESPLNCKDIQPVHPKGNQSCIFIGRTDAEAETPILWPPDAKNCLIWKDPEAGKHWRQEEMGTTEDEMVGWSHWHEGHAVVCLITQSCQTPCDPMDCSPPDSSVYEDFPGKSTGVGCHALLQGMFPRQGSNPGLLHCRQILYCLSLRGSPDGLWLVWLGLGSWWWTGKPGVLQSMGLQRVGHNWATELN